MTIIEYYCDNCKQKCNSLTKVEIEFMDYKTPKVSDQLCEECMKSFGLFRDCNLDRDTDYSRNLRAPDKIQKRIAWYMNLFEKSKQK